MGAAAVLPGCRPSSGSGQVEFQSPELSSYLCWKCNSETVVSTGYTADKEGKQSEQSTGRSLIQTTSVHQTTSDVINARHQVDNLLHELEYGVQQHKRLQREYEELLSHKDNFPAELHAEKEKNCLLQEELQKTCVSYHEISQRYENDIIAVRQQAYNAQLQFEKISVSQLEISQRYQTDVIAVRQQRRHSQFLGV